MKLKLYNKPLSFFQKNILILFKGTVISQLIGLIGSLVLAKIYGAEAYGTFGIFVSISAVLAIINTLQLNHAIIIAKNQHESKNLVNALFMLALILTFFWCLFLGLSSIFVEEVNSKFNIILLAIFGGLFYTYINILESDFTFSKNFKPIANAKVLTTVFNIGFQLLIYNKFKFLGLIYGNLIAIIVITLYYFIVNNGFTIKINLTLLKQSITNNRSIIKYILPSSLLNSTSINLIPILLVAFFSLKESGEYFLSIKILAAPLFLISSSVSKVYYQKSAELLINAKEKLFDLTRKLTIINFFIMFTFIVFINTIGITLLEYLFNKNWENLRIFTLILSFLIIAKSLFNPISNIIIVLNKNYISLLFNSYLLVVNITALVIGNAFSNIIISISLLSFFGGLGYVFLLIYFLKKLKKLKNDTTENIT